MTTCHVLTATYLTISFYLDMRIILYDTILAATIDGTLDESMVANGYVGLGGQCQRFNK